MAMIWSTNPKDIFIFLLKTISQRPSTSTSTSTSDKDYDKDKKKNYEHILMVIQVCDRGWKGGRVAEHFLSNSRLCQS